MNTKDNNAIVFTDDFINCLQRNNGVYVPYVPEKMRGMRSAQETPDVETLVVDHDSFPFFRVSPYTSVESPSDRGTVYVVHFTKGKRIVDSTLGNTKNKTLTPGTPGIILLFDEECYDRPVTVRLELEADTAQTMTINSTHELYSIDLSPGRAWYEVTFKCAERAYNFAVKDAPGKVYAFELLPDRGSETFKTND